MIVLVMNDGTSFEINEALDIRGFLYSNGYNVYNIAELIATDISLQRIRTKLVIKNDVPKQDKVFWFGSDAQFIAGNLGTFDL